MASIAFLAASLALPWASTDDGYMWLWGVEGGAEAYGVLVLLALILLVPLSVAAIAEARRGPSSFAATAGGLALLAELALYSGLVGDDSPDAEPALILGVMATAALAAVHLYTVLTATRRFGRRPWNPRPAEGARARAERIRHLGH